MSLSHNSRLFSGIFDSDFFEETIFTIFLVFSENDKDSAYSYADYRTSHS